MVIDRLYRVYMGIYMVIDDFREVIKGLYGFVAVIWIQQGRKLKKNDAKFVFCRSMKCSS